MSLIAALQLLISFVTQWYTVTRLGAGAETDALFAGMTLYQVVTASMLDPLALVMISVLSARAEEQRAAEAWPLFLVVGGVFIAMVVPLFIAAPFIVRGLVPGFTDVAKELTVRLTRIQLFGLVTGGCFSVLHGLCHARGRFLRTALASLACSMIGLALLMWKLSALGVTLAAWVQVIVVAGPMALLLPSLGRFDKSVWAPGLYWELWKRMQPLLLGAAYFRTGFVVDRFLGSFLPAGSVTILELAQRVHGAVVRVLNQGIVTQMLPRLSRLAEEGRWRQCRALGDERLWLMRTLSGAAVGVLLIAVLWIEDLVVFVTPANVFGRLPSVELATFGAVLMWSCGVLLCGGVSHALAAIFYALGDTRTPTRIGMLAYTVGLMLKPAGLVLAGVMGIAGATSLYHLGQWALLEVGLRGEWRERRAQTHGAGAEVFDG